MENDCFAANVGRTYPFDGLRGKSNIPRQFRAFYPGTFLGVLFLAT
jgi:hypothetical protein